MRVVVALGGNALETARGARTYEEQNQNVRAACEEIVGLVRHGHQPVVTHGNGPQIGDLVLEQEGSRGKVPVFPLYQLGAMTQGEIGSMIQRTLLNLMAKEAKARPVVSVITHVLVDGEDPAFSSPSKPIGPFYDAKTARRMASDRRVTVAKVEPRGSKVFRRVVPSPEPLRIVEAGVIRELVEAGVVVVAAGGGGVPVAKGERGELQGVDAVIDKDLTAERLGEAVDADALVILTDVDHVKLEFEKPGERDIERMGCAEARRWMEEGQFLAGSMRPKVLACVRFIEWGGSRAVISRLGTALEALEGRAGTLVTK